MRCVRSPASVRVVTRWVGSRAPAGDARPRASGRGALRRCPRTRSRVEVRTRGRRHGSAGWPGRTRRPRRVRAGRAAERGPRWPCPSGGERPERRVRPAGAARSAAPDLPAHSYRHRRRGGARAHRTRTCGVRRPSMPVGKSRRCHELVLSPVPSGRVGREGGPQRRPSRTRFGVRRRRGGRRFGPEDRSRRYGHRLGPTAQAETPARGHPGADLRGGGLLPVVVGPVRQARGLVGVRGMPAPAATERHRRLVGVPTNPDRPGVSSRVVHRIGPPESGQGARPGVRCRDGPRFHSGRPAIRKASAPVSSPARMPGAHATCRICISSLLERGGGVW